MVIQVAVVDDEQSAIDALEDCLNRYAQEKGINFCVSSFTSPVTFLEKYNAGYDIVFMDIQLPDYDGIEVMKKMRLSDNGTALVYVTNMANLAIRCYEVDAVDFIVKPVEFFSFSVKMDRILKRMSFTRNSWIRVRTKAGFSKLLLNSIISIEVYGHDIVYHTDAGDINTSGTLKALEKELGGHGFARCNNCFLVNLRYVVRIEGNKIYLSGQDKFIQISRSYKKSFMQAIEQFL